MTDINKDLEQLLYANITSFQAVNYEDLAAKIKALVVESLPKERKEGFDDKNWSEQYGEMGGWNDCLEEIRSIYQ